jgi:glyoxalase family protein
MSERPENPRIDGIHHVTAIASEPQPNLDFYVRFLGFRLVKRTVNFDDPGTYHFYYGDDTGAPGTLLTFFPWPGARAGRRGTGQVTTTAFAVPFGALDFWKQRAQHFGVTCTEEPERFGQAVLQVLDGDRLAIELIASSTPGSQSRPDGADIPAEFEIQGIHSATLCEANGSRTAELLTNTMGFRETGRENERIRFEAGAGGPGATVDLVVDASGPHALGGAGVVHHIAFRTPDAAHQERWREILLDRDYNVTAVMDRTYFQSIYYREPGGILFEIATDTPGFLIDESIDELGRSLKLPAEYERMRGQIEAALPAITVPTDGLMTESY